MDKPEALKSKVLVVEDNRLAVKVVTSRLVQEVGDQYEVATTFEEVKALLSENPGRFFVAIVDLYLPDAFHGEAVDYVISKGVPPIILSAEYRQEVRAMIMDKPIVDYVVKRNFLELDYLFSIVRRLRENVTRKVLVVDDSRSCRLILARYLERQNLNVLEASSAEQALVIIEQEQDICLVITDQNMGGMNGSEMIVQMRTKRSRKELAIIGVSGSNDKNLNALFLKSGANDFFSKPFSYEELFCRVTQNIDAVTLHKKLAESAELDVLTNTFSRKYLMRMGQAFHTNLLRDNVKYIIRLVYPPP